MIKTPTLIILGAGASMSYGFPSGAQLRQIIAEGRNQGSVLANKVHQCSGIERIDIQEFCEEFYYSNVSSIDSFLARYKGDREIGKLLIAAAIAKFESRKSLFENSEDNWYETLWNYLIEDVYDIETFKDNKLRILTFNYDRSLEHFLTTSMQNTFGITYQEAQIALKDIPITHIYGKLGELNNAIPKLFRPYKDPTSRQELLAASDSLRIIPEVRDDIPEFIQAKTDYDWAQQTFIMGFGFDKLNIQRLGFASVINSKPNQSHASRIYVTRLGMTEAEMMLAASAFGASDILWKQYSMNCSDFLRHHANHFA